MVDELETDAADLLTSLTKSLTEGPGNLLGVYIAAYLKGKDNPEALKELNDTARWFISKIPDLTRILSDSTKVLETFLDYKTAKRQEDATNSLLEQNKNLVKQTRNLTRATLIIAGANIIIVAYTILRPYL